MARPVSCVSSNNDSSADLKKNHHEKVHTHILSVDDRVAAVAGAGGRARLGVGPPSVGRCPGGWGPLAAAGGGSGLWHTQTAFTPQERRREGLIPLRALVPFFEMLTARSFGDLRKTEKGRMSTFKLVFVDGSRYSAGRTTHRATASRMKCSKYFSIWVPR